MDIRELDRRALDFFDKVADGLRTADLDLPTSCAGWRLRDLLRHQVSENTAFAVALREGSAPDWDSGSLGDDPYRAYADSVTAVLAAMEDDEVLNRQVTVREFGTFPGTVALSMHLVDSVAHGWDLAVTLGVPYLQDLEAVQAALDFARLIPAGPERDDPKSSFAPVVRTGPGASPLDELLGLLGRDPAWTP
ncbi:TIGR03086 family metal-binding protein [Amycolatopsis nigrescens]|uniref:TIGR03086 family metal-binding protein n=1 Tax=Amycolatopsis nigrescens TaxID=381445 RepID=UPI0003643B28|nr:TIGR03086 family metal-binding protein [Amycolatopsis nigrescens]